MAINWDEVREKARARGKANEQYIQSIQRAAAPSSPKVTPSLPKAQPKPLPTFQSVLDEYSTSLPGIGRQVAKALPEARKQEISQGTQRFFEQAPVQAGFMQGVSLNNPVKSLESKLGTDIDTSQAEQSGFYKAGEIGGIMTQFALPYAGASKGIGTLTAKALPSLGKFGQGVARSVATDIAVGLPLNVNYALNKEGLQGAEAAKSIGVNTAIDLITGGILEAVPLILKSGKKVASKADFDALSVPEKQEVVLRLTGPTEPQKLLSEGINWREPIRPDFYVNRGGAASPDVSAVQIAGELPAPAMTLNPARRKLAQAATTGDIELATLKGSEKQIKWAESIRDTMLRNIDAVIARKVNAINAGNASPARTENNRKFVEYLKGLKKTIGEKDSAKFFIDNQDLVNKRIREGELVINTGEVDDYLLELNANAKTKYFVPSEIKLTESANIGKGRPQRLKPIQPYLPRANREAPFTVTRGEMSAQALPKATPNIPPQASISPVQPSLPKKGTEISKEQPFAQSGLKSVGADVNLNKPKMKVSKVRANTIENSPMYSKAKKFMDSKDYEYEVISEKRSLAEAAQRLATGFEGEVKDLPNKANFDGVDLDTSMGIAEQYIKEAEASGDWSKVNQWSKLIQEKGTQGGQLIQAFAKYSRTPEGAVVKAQQTINKVENDIKKSNPNLIDKVEKETKQVTSAIKKAEEETFESLGDVVEKAVKSRKSSAKLPMAGNPIKSVEEAVASLTDKNMGELISEYTEASSKKLANQADVLQPKKAKQVAPLQQAFDDLTKELYKVAQETLPKAKTAKNDVKATDILKSAIENKQNYQEVWARAKFELQKKYANNPEAMELFNDFFEKDAIPDFSNKTVNSALDQAVKDMGVNIKDLILNNPKDKATTLTNIKQYIIDNTGATGAEAEALTKQIEAKYVEIVNGKNWAMLENLIKERVKTAPPNEFTKIKQLMNIGAYYSERYGKATDAATAKAINKTAKDFSQDLNKIVRQNKGDKQKLLTDIQNYVLYNTDVVGKDAKILAREIADEYDKILKAKTESALKQMFPEAYGKVRKAPTQKSTLEKVVELANLGAYDNQAIRDIIKAKNGLPVMDDTDIKNIYEAMKEAENYPEGSYLRRAYQAKAEQIISNKVPKEFRDKFRALQRLSMMTNLRTLFTRNPLGNVILGTAENIKDIPGAAIDRLVSLKTGQRTTVGLPNLPAQAKGFKQGLSEWRQDIKLGVDTSPSRGQLELPRGKTFQDKGIGKALNFLDNILIRGLQLGDRPFYQAAFNSRIEELRKLGITGEEAEKAARLFALERVFQNDSALSKGLQAVRQGMNDMVGGFPLGDLLIPFAQTPANILDKLLDYSPAGLGKALFHLGTTAGKGTFDQKLFVDRLARTFTGAGISLLTYALMEKGLISGNLSDSKDVRNAQTLQGQQAYSIKIGDTWYSFDWAQPIAGIIAGTVDAIKAGADSDDIIQATSEGAVAGIDTVFNQSVLQGLANLMSGYSPAMGIARSLMSSTSQATPTGMGQIARIIDPIVRETYDPNPVVRQGKKLVARIPFASRTLPAKIDVAGRVVKQSQGRGVGARMWENLLSPGLRRDETHDPVNAELLRLQSQTGNNAVLLNTAPKIFTDDGKKYILTSDEYVTYQKTMGQEAYSKIQKLMNTPEYRRMSDDEKAKAIKDIHEEAIQKARYEFYDNRGLPVTLALDKDYQEKFRGLKGQMTDKRFYAAVTDMKGKSRDIEKVFAAEQRGRVPDRFFEAFKISEESVEKARALKSAGLTADQYTKAMDGVKDMESDKLPNGKSIDNSLSKKKKAYIDSAFPNASDEQLKLLYELAGVSKTVGHYRPRFE